MGVESYKEFTTYSSLLHCLLPHHLCHVHVCMDVSTTQLQRAPDSSTLTTVDGYERPGSTSWWSVPRHAFSIPTSRGE